MDVNTKDGNGSGNGAESPLVVEQEIIDHISEISKNSRTTFFAIMAACVYSYLAISATSDAALLTNSGATPLPIIQVKVPVVWFYYFAPTILAVLFFYFHFYLERFWSSIIRLPLYHVDDRRGLDDYIYPWLISNTIICGGNPKLSGKRSLPRLEYALSALLAWGLIPIVLVFYWARYLTAHEQKGTILHLSLLILTASFAFRFYYLAKNAVLAIPDNSETNMIKPRNGPEVLRIKPNQTIKGLASILVLGGMLSYLSLSALYGLPAAVCSESKDNKTCRYYTTGTELLNWFGVQPFVDVSEKKIVTKPENWQALLEKPEDLRRYLETQSNLKLSKRNLRHINGQRAFLPASYLDRITLDYAELQNAILTSSELNKVSFREANLTHTDFQHARIVSTKFENVLADVSRFNDARFSGGDTNEQTIFSGDYYDAWFEHSEGDNLLFTDANLRDSHFNHAKISYSKFNRVDMAGAKLNDADFFYNHFSKTDFSNAEIKSSDLSYSSFDECIFTSTVIAGTVFEYSELINSQFDTPQEDSTTSVLEPVEKPYAQPRNIIDQFLGNGVQFKNCQINNTHFKNADLRSSLFEKVSFHNAQFSDSDLSGATFIDTDMSGVEFQKTDFSAADLKRVTGLDEKQIKNMCGNEETKLPKGFERLKPCPW